MKKIVCTYTLFFFLTFNFYSYCQEISIRDSLFLYSKGSVLYRWGLGHASEDIVLLRDTNLFSHLFHDHLWFEQSFGKYRIKDDSLFLYCTDNCEINWKGLGPIVVPRHDRTYNDTVFFESTTEEPIYTLTGKIIRNKSTINNIETNDSLIILKGDSVLYRISLEETAEYYTVIFNHVFKFYNNEPNLYKVALLKDGSLILNDNKYNRSEIQPYSNPKLRGNKR